MHRRFRGRWWQPCVVSLLAIAAGVSDWPTTGRSTAVRGADSTADDADDAATTAVRAAIRVELASRAGNLKAAEARRALRRLVRLEPEMASVVDGRIRIVARTVWRLPPAQTESAVTGLETFLRSALQRSAGTTGKISGRSVDDWVRESSIGTGEMVQTRLTHEVETHEILGALHDYMKTLDESGGWAREGLDGLNRRVRLSGDDNGAKYAFPLDDVTKVSWIVALRDQRGLPVATPDVEAASRRLRRGNAERDWNTMNKFGNQVQNFEQEVRAEIGPHLRRLVVRGLTMHVPRGFERPLLDADEASRLEVEVNVTLPPHIQEVLATGARAAAPPGAGGRRVIRDAGDQAAGYSFRVVNYQKLKQVPAGGFSELGWRPVERPAVDASIVRQDLHVDLGGFHGGTLSAVAFSPDGRQLAAAGDVIRIWNLETGRLERTLHAGRPTSRATGFRDVTYSPDGKYLLAAMTGTQHRIWIYETGDLDAVRFVCDGHAREVDKLAFSDDGRYLATADVDGRVFLWDWGTRSRVWGFQFANPLCHLSFDYMNSILAIDRTLDFSRIPLKTDDDFGAWEDTDPLIHLMHKAAYPPENPKVFTTSLGISRRSDVCVIGGRSDRNGERGAYRWCAAYSSPDGNDYEAPARRALVDHRYQILACAVSDDGKFCATGDATGLIQVWNARTGQIRHSFSPLGKPNLSVAFGGSTSLWRLGQDRYVGREWRYNHWAPLDRQFDLEKRILFARPPVAPPTETSRGGRQLDYDFTNRQLSLFENDQRSAMIDYHTKAGWQLFGYGFHTVSGLEAGYGAIVCSEDGGVACLDPATLRPRRFFSGHTSRVWSAASSADGKRLITSGHDGIIHVWSLEGFRPTYNVAALVDEDLDVTFLYPGTPSARQLAIGDRIESIGGLTPIEWLDSPRSQQRPSGPVSVVLVRRGQRLSVSVELTEMGDLVRPLLSAVMSDDGSEWVLWTTNGYFDCSPTASHRVGWVQSVAGDQAARRVDGSQLRSTKLRADVVNRTVNAGDDLAALREADAIRNPDAPPAPDVVATGAAQPPVAQALHVADAPAPPIVRMLEPREGTVTRTSAETIDVRAEVIVPSGSEPVIVFRVNDAETRARNIGLSAEAAQPAALVPAGFKRYVAGETIALRPGRNTIDVIARLPEVRSGEGTSRVTVDRRPAAAGAAGAKPTLHWCSIAISDYAGTTLQNLAYPRNDVEKVAAAVERRSKAARFPYQSVKFHRRIDEAASKDGIADLFDLLTHPDSPDRPQPGDTVALHISAHGGVVQGSDGFMLVPHGGDPKRPRVKCVLWSDFVELANSLGSRQIRLLLFIDTCRAGGLGTTDSGEAKILWNVLSGLIFTAGGARQSALEYSRWEHGAFSLALREALEGRPIADIPWGDNLRPDDDDDGMLDSQDLSRFLLRRVRALTTDAQQPEFASPGVGAPSIVF